MAMQTGELYVCSNSHCGCEIEVVKGAMAGGGGESLPHCCCGEEMRLATSQDDEHVEPAGSIRTGK